MVDVAHWWESAGKRIEHETGRHGSMLSVTCETQSWPIAGRFVISRGAKTEAVVVVVTVSDGVHSGRGESVPYPRNGETVESVRAMIDGVRHAVTAQPSRDHLQDLLPVGAARNALDCALWDFEAKASGVPAYRRAGLDALRPTLTAYTLSVGSPEAMAEAAARAAARPLLKVKLAGSGDADRLHAVRAAAPGATLIVDANESWSPGDLDAMLGLCARLEVALVEQPLPAGDDALLASVPHSVPICADESIKDRHNLAALRGRYDAVNIKLDKAGGLTEALATADLAAKLGFTIMVGCMVGTSLAMAPALLLASRAAYVDLDGPLLLARDRPDGLHYEGSMVHPPSARLWG